MVGGPIQYALDAAGNFDRTLETVVRAITTSVAADGLRVLSAHLTEGFGEEDVRGKSLEVARRDYNWMSDCDVFVAVLPAGADGRPYRSDGTCVEIGWAAALGRPVVLVVDARAEYSHLVQGLSAITSVQQLDYAAVTRDPAIVVTAVRQLTGSLERVGGAG
jgi:nucleoside 2-deoxyribosyltransferase